MTGTYQPLLVILSVVIATIASLAALTLGSRIAVTAGWARAVWLAGGSLAMGVGIWSMHFVGMLAFRLPVPMTYSVPLLVLSVVVAVAASALALFAVGRSRIGVRALLTAGALMGGAIAGMHYIGMASLRTGGSLSYHTGLVLASVGIAVGASLAALWVVSRYRDDVGRSPWLPKLASAVVMGCAIAGMHYTAMAAARFGTPGGATAAAPGAVLATGGLAAAVAVGTLLILSLALLGAIGDQWARAKTAEAAALRRNEAALRQTTQTLQALIRSSPLAIYAMSADGTVQSWNPAAERLFGWTEAEVLGRSLPFLREEDRLDFAALRRRVLDGGALTDLEVTRIRRDGTELVLALAVAPLYDETAMATGLIAVAADVTERRQLAQQLQQAQKMEAVGQLAGGVAHDFNNILTIITGYSGLLLDELSIEDPRRRDVAGIQEAAARAAQLTNQLLAFSRRQVRQPMVLDPNRALEDTASMLRRVLGEHIALSIKADPSIAPVVADPGQFSQIILNLAVNARDAMPQGGSLTIETAMVELDQAYASQHLGVQPGRYVQLAVSDTGHGMSPDIQAHIFEPFFTTKERGKGTGLGLATVFGIVKQSGGHIFVYSEPGHGATFKVLFPAAGESAAIAGHERQAAAPQGSETVLLVEDDGTIRYIASRVLSGAGYRVLEAAHPGEALLVSEQHGDRIDLLLTDVMMPRMNGRVLAERLRVSRPEMAVLYMSGYTDNAIVHHGVLDADTAFLAKPFTPPTLLAAVRTTLDASAAAATRPLPAMGG
jgi:PAS domain S-box-containing protein